MHFGFTEEQDMIRKSARDFVKGQSSFERLRKLFDDERGYGADLFKQMADAGWLGTVYPEAYGGLGLGYVDLLCIQEELGKGLLTEPLHTSLTAGNAILIGGSEAQKQEWLPQVAAGEVMLALAVYELNGRFNLNHVETTATASGGGFKLNGSKSFVPDAASADKLIVSARVSGGVGDDAGIGIFIVDRDAPGVTVTPIKTVDHRKRFTVDLKDVAVSADRQVGDAPNGLKVMEEVIDRATVALCAEMIGGMEAALQMSIAYSKERVQFGKPIGSFQAIKHKAANMYVDLETARSATYYATMAVDENQPDQRAAISAAKALCSDAYLHVAKDAIQIHGGIGYTEECDVPFYYKRALAAGVTFGDAAYHRDRYAAEKGF